MGTLELLVVLIIVLVIFGGSRLPEIGKGFGQAIRNFKKAASEADEIDITPKKKPDDKNEKEKEETKGSA